MLPAAVFAFATSIHRPLTTERTVPVPPFCLYHHCAADFGSQVRIVKGVPSVPTPASTHFPELDSTTIVAGEYGDHGPRITYASAGPYELVATTAASTDSTPAMVAAT